MKATVHVAIAMMYVSNVKGMSPEFALLVVTTVSEEAVWLAVLYVSPDWFFLWLSLNLV